MARYKHRHGTLAANDLLEFEIGYFTDTNEIVIGDGSSGTKPAVMGAARTLVDGPGNIIANATSGNLVITDAGGFPGTVVAETFDGTATAAQYSDLAENYTSDKVYEAGTVLFHGTDAEADLNGDIVIGVVSDKPGYLMNSNISADIYVPIALKGRIPLKLSGACNKGDVMIADMTKKGFATVGNKADVNTPDYIGIALCDSTQDVTEVKV